MTAPTRPRLAIVLSHPTQYYSPWFRWIAEHGGIEFHVFYLWNFGVTPQRDRQFERTVTWDVDLLSGYPHDFIPNTARDPGTHRFGGLQNPQLPARLSSYAPDALLLFGYKWAAHIRAIAWARRRRVALLFRGDSHLLGRVVPPLRSRLLLRILYAQFQAFLAVGAANRDYFRAFGVPENKIHFAPHSVNHELFDRAAPGLREAALKLRARLGIDSGTRVILFAGKLVAAKQPRELLDTFVALRPENAALVFVGDGPEKDTLSARARNAPPRTIHFLPFANQSEMPSRYAIADLFVLPSCGSYETWGLAVNEAMHMGVPPLVSDLVGCQRDLVTDGETGWVFAAGNPANLKAKLELAIAQLADVTAAATMREQIRSRIERYTYAATTSGLLNALSSVGFPGQPART